MVSQASLHFIITVEVFDVNSLGDIFDEFPCKKIVIFFIYYFFIYLFIYLFIYFFVP